MFISLICFSKRQSQTVDSIDTPSNVIKKKPKVMAGFGDFSSW